MWETFPKFKEDTLSSKKSLNEVLERIILDVEKIKGAAAVAEDGVVLADVNIDDPDNIGAISVFIGMTGNYIGETLGIGQMKTGIVDIKGEKLLIFNVGNFQLGILIEPKASARFTISEVNGILDEEFNRGE